MGISARQRAILPAAMLATIALAACASNPGAGQTHQDRIRMDHPQVDNTQRLDVDVRTRDVTEAQDVSIPAVQAFDLLPNAYKAIGINTVAVVDTSAGVYTVGVRNMPVHGRIGGARLSRYIDCGSAPMHTPADSYDVYLTATTYVTPSGAGAVLHTLVTANARDPAGNTPPVRCTSTGALEQRIAELVSAHG